jgi:hypothetical protein
MISFVQLNDTGSKLMTPILDYKPIKRGMV